MVHFYRGISLKCKTQPYSLTQPNLGLSFSIENHRIKLKDINKLVYQLSYLRREYTETGIMKIKSDEHDDYPDSLVLACKAVASGDGWYLLDVGKGIKNAMFG